MFLVENRHHGQPLEFLGKFHGNPIRVAPCHDPGELVDDQSAMFPFKYDFNPEFFRHTGSLLGFQKKTRPAEIAQLTLEPVESVDETAGNFRYVGDAKRFSSII